jgi:hypothetical protein
VVLTQPFLASLRLEVPEPEPPFELTVPSFDPSVTTATIDHLGITV